MAGRNIIQGGDSSPTDRTPETLAQSRVREDASLRRWALGGVLVLLVGYGLLLCLLSDARLDKLMPILDKGVFTVIGALLTFIVTGSKKA